MKYSFDECWEALKSKEFQEAAQKPMQELYLAARKANPNMTAKQWQFLKCYFAAGAMVEANRLAEIEQIKQWG